MSKDERDDRESNAGGLTRREFLKRGTVVGAGLAAAGLLSGSLAGRADAEELASNSSVGAPKSEFNTYFGDLHAHTGLSFDGLPGRTPDDAYAVGKLNRLDFVAVTDHVQHAMTGTNAREWAASLPNPAILKTFERGKVRDSDGVVYLDWDQVKNSAKKHNEPGRFVSMLAYEWSSTTWGDHNVYYPVDDAPIRYGSSLRELYRSLDGVDCILIPHHPGYQVGLRGMNWALVDTAREPVAEICSGHGNSEFDDTDFVQWNHPMGPRCGGGTGRSGLNMGKEYGVIGSTDNHGSFPGSYGVGLAAILAKDLTRESLYQALKARRTYMVSGDRILLDFRLNGAIMGSSISAEKGHPRELLIRTDAWRTIESIDVIKNGYVVKQFLGYDRNDRKKTERFKVGAYFGWTLAPRKWDVTVSVKDGVIAGMQPCIEQITLDHAIPQADHSAVALSCTVPPNNRQGMFLDIKGDRSSRIVMSEGGQVRLEATMAELVGSCKEEQPYGHMLGAFYCVRASGEPQFADSIHWSDKDVSGHEKDYYYIRVRQKNGHMACSSPVFVRNA